MKTAIATVITDDFVDGGRVLLSSLREQHPETDYDVIVFYNDEVAPLSQESMQQLHKVEPSAEFRHVDVGPYERLFEQRDKVLNTPARLIAAFVILEAFRLSEYARVICLDSDMLIVGRLDELFSCENEFAAVTAVDEVSGELRQYFNTGVMVIGSAHLTGSTFDDLTQRTMMTSVDRERGKADQAVLNRYFETRDHRRLDQKFNITKRMVPDNSGDIFEQLTAQDARILHFVGAKPWTVNWSPRDWGYESAEALWLSNYFALEGSETARDYFASRRQAITNEAPNQ